MSLWNLKVLQSLEQVHSPQIYVYRFNCDKKETSFCTRHKASLTVEAMVVIPIFTICLLCLLYFFRILQVQVMVERALLDAGRQVAVESCVVNDASSLLLSAEAFMLLDLKDEDVIQKYVTGGAVGVVLLGSSFEEDEIVLCAQYRVGLPVAFFGWKGILLRNCHTFHKWNAVRQQEWVYVTETGDVYHKSKECRTIHLKIQSAKMVQMEGIRGESGQRYYPCYRCTGEVAPHTKVYYTLYGELFHGSLECSAIKRTVSRISPEEIKDRRPCSICGE